MGKTTGEAAEEVQEGAGEFKEGYEEGLVFFVIARVAMVVLMGGRPRA